MSENSNNSSGGIGLFGAIFIVFLVLKLTGAIDWSWWWVTSPLWGAFALVFVIWALFVLGMGGVGIVDTIARRRRNKRRNK